MLEVEATMVQLTQEQLAQVLDEPTREARCLGDALATLGSARSSLSELTQYGSEKLVAGHEAVETGRSVNGLGEVQGMGSSIDVACCRYQMARTMAEHAAADWKTHSVSHT